MPARSGRRGAATALGLVLVIVAAAGCTADDPREGGFIGGVMGLLSGRYDRSVEAKRARLEQLEAERRGLHDDERRLARESGELRIAAARRRQEAAALAARTAEVEAEIRELRRAARAAEPVRAPAGAAADRLEGGRQPSGSPPAGEADPAAATAPRDGSMAALLEQAAELEAELGALQEEAARARDDRARLRGEIERLTEELARGAASQP